MPRLQGPKPESPSKDGRDQYYEVAVTGEINGKAALASTAAYPPEFGRAVAECFLRSVSATTNENLSMIVDEADLGADSDMDLASLF